MNRLSIISASIVVLAVASVVVSAPITFDNRDKLNVVKSDLAVVSDSVGGAGGGLAPQNLAGGSLGDGTWQNSFGSVGTPTSLTINLGTVRNVATIKLWERFGGYGLSAATVQTSADGSTWSSPLANTVTNPNTANTNIALGAPVDTQYLRITEATALSGAGMRWIISHLEVLGSAGAIADDNHLNLISGTAFATNPVTLTTTTGITATTAAQFIDDSFSPLTRGVMYGLSAGKTFTVNFGRSVSLGKFGLTIANGADASFQFKVETSPDGSTSWTDVLDHTSGGISLGASSYALAPSTGQYLRFTVLTTNGSPYIGSISAFSSAEVPEPATLGLLVLGGLGLLFQRRVRQ